MSGMEQIEARFSLISKLKEEDPNLSESYEIMNDSDGSIYTACSQGGE